MKRRLTVMWHLLRRKIWVMAHLFGFWSDITFYDHDNRIVFIAVVRGTELTRLSRWIGTGDGGSEETNPDELRVFWHNVPDPDFEDHIPDPCKLYRKPKETA